jgi:hypothetical protein
VRKTILLWSLLLSLSCFAGRDPICPIDDYEMYFTGKTKIVEGTLLGLYRCPRGHSAWAKL